MTEQEGAGLVARMLAESDGEAQARMASDLLRVCREDSRVAAARIADLAAFSRTEGVSEYVVACTRFVIGMAKTGEAVAALQRMLDEEPEVKKKRTLLLCLGETMHADALPTLIAVVEGSQEAILRREAAQALAYFDDGRATEAIAAAMSDEAADVRERAAWAAGEIAERNRDAVRRIYEPLVRLLNDHKVAPTSLHYVSHTANATLERLDPEVVQDIIDAGGPWPEPSEAPRRVRRLNISPEAALGAVRWMDPEVRETSAGFLGQFRLRATPEGEQVVNAEMDPVVVLAWVLRYDPAGSVRLKAAQVLAQRRDERALESLLHALRYDTSGSVRKWAAGGLGALRAEAAIPYLKEAAYTGPGNLTREACRALGEIGAAALSALEEIVDNPPERNFTAACFGVPLLGSDGVPLLIRILESGSQQQRNAALLALGMHPFRDARLDDALRRLRDTFDATQQRTIDRLLGE